MLPSTLGSVFHSHFLTGYGGFRSPYLFFAHSSPVFAGLIPLNSSKLLLCSQIRSLVSQYEQHAPPATKLTTDNSHGSAQIAACAKFDQHTVRLLLDPVELLPERWVVPAPKAGSKYQYPIIAAARLWDNVVEVQILIDAGGDLSICHNAGYSIPGLEDASAPKRTVVFARQNIETIDELWYCCSPTAGSLQPEWKSAQGRYRVRYRQPWAFSGGRSSLHHGQWWGISPPDDAIQQFRRLGRL